MPIQAHHTQLPKYKLTSPLFVKWIIIYIIRNKYINNNCMSIHTIIILCLYIYRKKQIWYTCTTKNKFDIFGEKQHRSKIWESPNHNMLTQLHSATFFFFNGKIKSQCNFSQNYREYFIIGNLLSAPCETNNRIRNITQRLIYLAANYTIIK